MQASQFIAVVSPYAVTLRLEGSPMFPSLRIAQNMWETGCTIHEWYNLGGIKVGSGQPNGFWKGATVNKGTWEVYDGVRQNITSDFRAYDSIYDFYKDQDLLFGMPRYERVGISKTPQEQAQMLLACGYATDPNYSNGLIGMIRTYDLERFDREVDNTMEELLKRLAALEELTKHLQESSPPDWFVTEFTNRPNLLDGIVNTPMGDKNFWRNIAVAIRLIDQQATAK